MSAEICFRPVCLHVVVHQEKKTTLLLSIASSPGKPFSSLRFRRSHQPHGLTDQWSGLFFAFSFPHQGLCFQPQAWVQVMRETPVPQQELIHMIFIFERHLTRRCETSKLRGRTKRHDESARILSSACFPFFGL